MIAMRIPIARLGGAGLLAVLLALTGCASTPPPVQEMSDARLALEAARDAGAEKFAPSRLQRAQMLLSSAESHLKRRTFLAARRDANAAKTEAVEARRIAEEASGKPQRFREQPPEPPKKAP